MDEVDGIIILSLKQIGCDLSVSSMAEFDADLTVSSCAACLHAINNDLSFPDSLPKEMSGRFRACTNLAKACHDLGYTGELGFDQFLYPSENDTRKLFMWLVERLPQHSSENSSQPLDASNAINQEIENTLNELYNTFWTPSHLRKRAQATNQSTHGTSQFSSVMLNGPSVSKTKPQFKYHTRYYRTLNSQPRRFEQLRPSVVHNNRKMVVIEQEMEALGGGKHGDQADYEENVRKAKAALGKITADSLRAAMSKTSGKTAKSLNDILEANAAKAKSTKSTLFANTSDFVNSNEDSVSVVVKPAKTDDDGQDDTPKEDPEQTKKNKEEALRKQREEEILALEQQIEELEQRMRKYIQDIDVYKASMRHIEENWNFEEGRQEKLEEDYRLLKEVMDKLPEADKHIAALKELSQEGAAELLELAEEWETHRVPLIQEYRSKKGRKEEKQKDWKRMVEEIKVMRSTVKQYVEDIHEREDRYKKLYKAYENMPKDVDRSTYTRKIHEIVKNVRKQKLGIEQILSDTRGLQKEINSVSDTLGRVYSETDEYVFGIAKQDPSAANIYKGIAKLHEQFGVVVKAVESTGSAEIQCRDLQAQIEAVQSRMSNLNAERVKNDLKQIKAENNALIKKLGG